MIRVVLDTNIIVSALLQPLGPPAQVFVLASGGSIQLCISGSVYAEYEEVISRPRFRRSEAIIAGALHTIRQKGLWVQALAEYHLGRNLRRVSVDSRQLIRPPGPQLHLISAPHSKPAPTWPPLSQSVPG